MRLLGLLTLLAMSCVLCSGYAGVCKHPKPMENFDMKRFSGAWYYAALNSTHPREELIYGFTRCAVLYYHLDKARTKINIAEADIIVGGIPRNMRGLYYFPDPNKGILKVSFQDLNPNSTYEYTVLCTDYTTYQAAYACVEVAPGFTSEFVFLLIRDPAYYEEVFAIDRLPYCYRNVMKGPISKIKKHVRVDCPEE